MYPDIIVLFTAMAFSAIVSMLYSHKKTLDQIKRQWSERPITESPPLVKKQKIEVFREPTFSGHEGIFGKLEKNPQPREEKIIIVPSYSEKGISTQDLEETIEPELRNKTPSERLDTDSIRRSLMSSKLQANKQQAFVYSANNFKSQRDKFYEKLRQVSQSCEKKPYSTLEPVLASETKSCRQIDLANCVVVGSDQKIGKLAQEKTVEIAKARIFGNVSEKKETNVENKEDKNILTLGYKPSNAAKLIDLSKTQRFEPPNVNKDLGKPEATKKLEETQLFGKVQSQIKLDEPSKISVPGAFIENTTKTYLSSEKNTPGSLFTNAAPQGSVISPGLSIGLFGGNPPTSGALFSSTSSANIFGFSKAEKDKKDESSEKKPLDQNSLFGPKSTKNSEGAEASSVGLFNAFKTENKPDIKNQNEIMPASEAKNSSLFSYSEKQSSNSIFGSAALANSTENKAPSLFGSIENKQTSLFSSTEKTNSMFEKAEGKGIQQFGTNETKSLFGSVESKGPQFFGGTESKSLFTSTENKSLFPSETKSLFPSTETKSLFGSAETKSLFASTESKSTENKHLSIGDKKPLSTEGENKTAFGESLFAGVGSKSLFGTGPSATEQKFIFGSQNANTGSTESKFLFGSSQTIGETKNLFETSSTGLNDPSKNPSSLFLSSSVASSTGGSLFGAQGSSFGSQQLVFSNPNPPSLFKNK